MTSEPECADAKSDERSSESSTVPPESELPLSYAVLELCQQIRESNALMLTLVQQNAALMEVLMPEGEEGTGSQFDMEGNLVRIS